MKANIIAGSFTELSRVGGEEYAERHAGNQYGADIRADGWAYNNNAKFAPNTFSVVVAPAEHAAHVELVNRLNVFQSNYADFDHHPEFKPVIAALANLAAIQGAK
jgi:hypothetical protein